METVKATCPKCHAKHLYGEELIGRYTFCKSCKCRFYLEVPPLEEPAPTATEDHRVMPAPRADTTLDDVLSDTQQGSRHLAQLLRRHEVKLNWLIGLALVAAVLAICDLALRLKP